jgi:hypothetical protein
VKPAMPQAKVEEFFDLRDTHMRAGDRHRLSEAGRLPVDAASTKVVARRRLRSGHASADSLGGTGGKHHRGATGAPHRALGRGW